MAERWLIYMCLFGIVAPCLGSVDDERWIDLDSKPKIAVTALE